MTVHNKAVIDNTLVMAGTFGNMTEGEGMRFVAPASGVVLNDEVILGVIPAGAMVTEFRVATDGLGVGATLDIGYRAVVANSTLPAALTYWGTAGAVATAGVTDSLALPIKFTEPVYIVATVKGAVPAAGKYVQVFPRYIYRNV